MTARRFTFGAAVALAAVLGAGLGASSAQAAAAALTAAAPAGFEALERPQTTLVDVYVGGVRVASTLARYTPNSLTFLKPDEVAAAIPHLKPGARVREALAVELPANAGKVCGDDAPEDCGRLSPELVGAIFDEARFRVDLFVNPAFLDVAAPLSGRYLPAPARRISAVSLMGGVISGASDSGPAYGLQNRTVVSVGALRLASELTQSSGDGFRPEALSLALDRGPLRAEAGLLTTPALDFFGQGRVVGASLGTQLDTLENRDLVAATPLLVYLAQRARVEVYRGQRLVSAGVYDAGNQLVDTSSLPDGSYEVLLRIREAGGAVREERRFFSRSRRVPPLGRPQFQVTVGSLVDGNETDGRGGLLVQASYARRLSRGLAVEGAAALVGDETVLTGAASWLTQSVQMRAGAVASTRGDYGVLVDAVMNFGPLAMLAFDVRKTWSRDGVAPAVDPVSTDLVPSATAVSRYGFAGDGEQATASLSTAVRGALIALTANYSHFRGADAAYAFGASVDSPIGRGRWSGLRLYASAAETDRGLQAHVGLRFRLSRGRAAVFGEAEYRAVPTDTGDRSGVVASVSGSDELTTRAGEADLAGAYAHTALRDTVSGSAALRGEAGEAAATLEQDFRGPQTETRYSASFAVGAAFAGGRPTLGGSAGGESGIVVSVDAPKGAGFRVLVDDAPVGRVTAGGTYSLFLPAYRIYRVRLAPLNGAPLSFDTAERRVSLFPGNVSRLSWTAAPEVEVFGRVLDARGAPLVNAVVAGGASPSSTDANGWFQATLGVGRELVITGGGRGSCRLNLRGVDAPSGYAALGTRTCQPSADPPPSVSATGA